MKCKPNRLRVTRAEKRVSQLDLALAVGISQSKLSLIENAYVEPTPEERADMAHELGVAESELFPEAAEAKAS